MEESPTLTLEEVVRKSVRTNPSPCLFLVMHADAPTRLGSRHTLTGVSRVRIGRSTEPRIERGVRAGETELAIGIADRWMSSSHAILARTEEGGWRVEDAGSKNGTLVNSQKLSEPHVLKPGDTIMAGHLVIEYRTGETSQTQQTVMFVEPSQAPEIAASAQVVTDLSRVLGDNKASDFAVPQGPALSGSRSMEALIKAGQELTGWVMEDDSTIKVKAINDIPIGHKVATKEIRKGDTVIKYGHDIGKAVADIKVGEHAHIHNIKTKRW